LQHATSDVEKMVLGNKCDMNDRRQVSKDRGSAVSKSYLSVLENSSQFRRNFIWKFATVSFVYHCK